MVVHQSFASSFLQNFSLSVLPYESKSNSLSCSVKFHLKKRTKLINQFTISTKTSIHLPKCSISGTIVTGSDNSTKSMGNFPEIDERWLQELVDHALVWSSLHGLVVGDKNLQRSSTVPGVGIVHAPITLLPTQFPETHWKQACDLAPIFNELIDRVSLDSKFLQESLSRTKKVDSFTSKLLAIHSKVFNRKEKLRLGLHRSDYMVDKQTGSLLQVEFNTISSSFCGLSTRVNELHRKLVNQYEQQLRLDSESVPINNPVTGFSHALAKAWREYGNKKAVILFIVQKEENNIYDQYWLSSELIEIHGIKSIRKTLADVDSEGILLEDGTLLIGDDIVSIIYFRAGYTPSDYPSESEWRARLLLERSSAIKCPSISYHLAGTKKIQQELAKPGVLEMFMENKDDISKLRQCFAGLWSLDDSDAVEKAIRQPELFVIKPQREGGGNNIYGDEVRKTLETIKMGEEDSAAYILMQRIFPNVFPTYFIRNGVCKRNSSVSELGIYSAYLKRNEEVIVNDQCGYLMRTKFSSSNEGGVAAGFAVLDSIYLT